MISFASFSILGIAQQRADYFRRPVTGRSLIPSEHVQDTQQLDKMLILMTLGLVLLGLIGTTSLLYIKTVKEKQNTQVAKKKKLYYNTILYYCENS